MWPYRYAYDVLLVTLMPNINGFEGLAPSFFWQSTILSLLNTDMVVWPDDRRVHGQQKKWTHMRMWLMSLKGPIHISVLLHQRMHLSAGRNHALPLVMLLANL